MVQLPPEVYSAIASYVTQRDLLTLSHTSHAFQRAAEPRIYESVVLRDVHSAFIACHAITVREGTRGPYVKRFILYQDPRRMLPRMNLNAVPPQFWLSVQQALKEMVNLEYVVIHDPLVSQSWVLGHEDIHFQALELNLRLQWDSHLVAFLQTQTKLHALLLGADAAAEDQDGPLCPLPVTALQTLEVFSGPLLVAAELLGCPLTRMQILVDQDTAPILPTVVSDLGKIMGTLRKLHIVGIPEALTLETVQLVSTSIFAPILRSLGVLPISVRELPAIHRCLMKLPALELLELDVTRWDPQPHDPHQRILLLDFRIYCPTLQNVVFWIGQHRFTWCCRDGQWTSVQHPGRMQSNEHLWRT